MAARIAQACPGYGNPWHLPFGQWLRILAVLDQITPPADEVGRLKAIVKGEQRRERRLQTIRKRRS